MKVVPARYRYRLFEAKTAKLIAIFTLMGTVDTCPFFEGGMVGQPKQSEYVMKVFDDDLAAKVRPYVTGPARP